MAFADQREALPGFHPTAARWIQTRDGLDALRKRSAAAAQALLEPGLVERLQFELENSRAGGSNAFGIARSLHALSDELVLLAFASFLNESTPKAEAAWQVVIDDLLPLLLSLEHLSFQGRNHRPAWSSDLATATIGSNLAWSIRLGAPLGPHAANIEAAIRNKCLAPILEEWLENRTRIHSLDSMGHNWWAVLVSSAGVMATLLDEEAEASRIARRLLEWFQFPGRRLSRKGSNFGPEGDYLEGFEYCEYALANVCVFAQLRCDFQWGLSPAQMQGLADWLKRSYVRTREGWRLQRFGDVGAHHYLRTHIWHTLARATGDTNLLALAHEIKPAPRELGEFLLWEPCPDAHFNLEPSLRAFPTSGLAFDVQPKMTVASRAGEAWCHNHMDAGTFIFQQNGVVWIDDAGTCDYSHQDYLDYYVTPWAHNVAYAPGLCPSPKRISYSGLPNEARYLCAEHFEELAIWCADTGMLSGGALARSYRWFFRLGNYGLLVWDDLAAHGKQSFEYRINTAASIGYSSTHEPVSLHQFDESCRLAFFCDSSAKFSVEPIHRGEPDGRIPGDPSASLYWSSAYEERIKFGLTLGTRFREARWSGSAEEGGWKCRLQTDDDTIWRIWFNPLADGRVMHQNSVSQWEGFETDAYALILRERDDDCQFAAIEASFVRRDGNVLLSHLNRRTEARFIPFTNALSTRK